MMQRREFAQNMGTAILGLGLSPVLLAQQKSPEEGSDYLALDKPVATEPKGKVEVIEFFWYSCPHCNHFEPTLQKWLENLPKDVVFKRVPVAFRDSFVPQQRLFYALEAMGKLDALHKKVFHAIHEEKQTLDKEELIAAWVEKQGLDRQKFLQSYNSFSVNAKAGKAAQIQKQFEVSGVPSLGIGGRYYTDGTMAQNMARALKVTEFLIDKVRHA